MRPEDPTAFSQTLVLKVPGLAGALFELVFDLIKVETLLTFDGGACVFRPFDSHQRESNTLWPPKRDDDL